MPNVSGLVSAIGADVNAKLVAAGYPALWQSTIQVGRVHLAEQAVPPRIVFIPKGSTFAARDTFNRMNQLAANAPGSRLSRVQVTSGGTGFSGTPTVAFTGGGGTGAAATAIVSGGVVIGVVLTSAGSGYTSAPTVAFTGGGGTGAAATAVLAMTPELLQQVSQRAIQKDAVEFEVHCWGQAVPPDPNNGGDFDATMALYQQVIASTFLLANGAYDLGRGVWASEAARATQIDRAGAEYVFSLSIETPVLDQLLPTAPVGTVIAASTYLQPSDGSAKEQGC